MENRPLEYVTTSFGQSAIYRQNGGGERVWIIPGYAETLNHSAAVIDWLGLYGFDALTFTQPRHQGAKAYRTPIERQGEVVAEIVESYSPKANRQHALAHSMGGAAVVKAALADPELFDTLILTQTLGLTSPQTLRELGIRGLKKAPQSRKTGTKIHEARNDYYAASLFTETPGQTARRTISAQMAGAVLSLRNPSLALREALAARQHNIVPDIQQLVASRPELSVHVLLAHGDELLPDKTASQQVRELLGFAAVHYLAMPQAGHDASWTQPRLTAEFVDSLNLAGMA